MNKKQKEVWTILSTPDDIDFKKFRELHDDFWLNQKREILWISSMETSHILNCIAMLERNDQQYTKAYDGLCREVERRTNIKVDEWNGYEN